MTQTQEEKYHQSIEIARKGFFSRVKNMEDEHYEAYLQRILNEVVLNDGMAVVDLLIRLGIRNNQDEMNSLKPGDPGHRETVVLLHSRVQALQELHERLFSWPLVYEDMKKVLETEDEDGLHPMIPETWKED